MKKGIFIIMVLAILTLCILPVMAENMVPLVPELSGNLEGGIFTVCEYNSRAEMQTELVLDYWNSFNLMSDNIEYSCIKHQTRFDNDNDISYKLNKLFSELEQEPQLVFRWPDEQLNSLDNEQMRSFYFLE